MAGMGKPPVVQPPPPPKVVRQPVPDDPKLKRAGQLAQENALRRSGRQSTMLTRKNREVVGAQTVAGGGDKLG